MQKKTTKILQSTQINNNQKQICQNNINLPWFCHNCHYDNQEMLLDNRIASNENIMIFKNQKALKSVENLLQKQMDRKLSQNQGKVCSLKNIQKIKESKRSLRQTIRISAKFTTSPTLDSITEDKVSNLLKTTTSTNIINCQYTEKIKSRQLQRQIQNNNISQSNNILSLGNINSFKSLDLYPNQMNYNVTGSWQKNLKNCQMTRSIVCASTNIQKIKKIPSQQNLARNYHPQQINQQNTYQHERKLFTKNIYMKNQKINEQPLRNRQEHILRRNNKKQNELKVNFKESPLKKQKCQYLLSNIRKKSTSTANNQSLSQISQNGVNFSQIGKHLKIGIRRVQSFNSSEDEFSQVLSHGHSFLMAQIHDLQYNSCNSQISLIQHVK